MQFILIIHTVIVSDTLQSHFEDRNSKQIAFSTLIDAFSSVTVFLFAPLTFYTVGEVIKWKKLYWRGKVICFSVQKNSLASFL